MEIQRYDMQIGENAGGWYIEQVPLSCGDWVRWEEVEKLLASKSPNFREPGEAPQICPACGGEICGTECPSRG